MSRLLVLSCLVFCACPRPVDPPPPEPGPLQAAVATRRLDIPIGIAMGGYSRSRPGDEPGSAWAKQMPSSRGLHSEPTVRVIAMTNGLERVVFIRMDTTLISSTLRARTQAALTAAGESAHVFMHATHSHASPARIMPPARLGGPTGTDFVSLVMDHYDAEVEDLMTRAVVAATTDAFANLKRVSVGVSSVEGGDFNNDRRCENDLIYGPNYRDTAFTLLRFDEVDDSGAPVKPLTAMLNYPMHGTMLGSQNTLISTEITGALELYASDLIGVPVMYVQGAAGDVSPKDSPLGHDALQGIERQGRAAAVLVKQAFEQAAPGAAKPKSRLDFRERGVTLSREAMGYVKDEFPEWGGIQCGAGGMSPTCGSIVSKPADVVCFPLEPRRPFKTAMTLVQLDDIAFLSTPGELGTGLSHKLHTALEPLGASTVLAIGYSQDHYGYLLEEDDWMRGGYEPTVSAWGWKFGPYLLSELQTFVSTIDQQQPSADQAELPEVTVRTRGDSLGPAVIVTEPVDGQRLTTHVFEFEGGDPGLGAPQVALEVESGGAFLPVQASATRAVVNGPELLLRYAATPTFRADANATARKYVWSVQFETLPTTPLATYRLVAKGRIKLAGVETAYSLISRGFVVSASDAATERVAARFTSDGRLALEVRFPPNPTQKAANRDDVVKNYRVRDADADPREGARVKGGTVQATLNGAATTLNWSEAERAWVSEPQSAGAVLTVEVAVNGLTDGAGNRNGLALSTTATR